MPEVLVKVGTPVVWADTTDFSSTVSGYTRTHQLDLTGVTDTQAREGAKANLGATRAERFSVRVGIEVDVAPTAGAIVEFYWSGSFSATAGTGTDGGAAGVDGDFKAGAEDEWKAQWRLIGTLVLTADASGIVQIATINPGFRPGTRHGQVMVLSKAGQALEADAVEMFVAFEPVIDEVQ